MDTKSQHLLLDLILSEEIKPIHIERIKLIIEKNLNVISRIEHQFTPHGETILFILSESHFALHTYPEHNYFSLDIYVCNLKINLEKIVIEIKKSLPILKSESTLIYRGKIVGQKEKNELMFIYLLTLFVALGSILYEFLLAQSLSTTMGNTALRYNLTIGIYIAAMGFGALMYQKFIKGDLYKEFIKTEVMLSLIGATAPILVLIADYFFNYLSKVVNVSFYSTIIQWPLFAFNHILIILIGLISGIELPMLIEMGRKYQSEKNHRILAVDYLGTLIGAISFPVFILPSFHIFTIGYIVSFLNIIASVVVAIKGKTIKNGWKISLIILLIIWLIVILNANGINHFLVERFYFGGRI